MSKTFAFRDGDWVIESNGQPLMLSSGIDNVGQYVVHALSHPYDPTAGYGFEFLTSTSVVSTGSGEGILRRDVSAAMSRLQQAQSRLGSRVSDTERVTGITGMVVREVDGGLVYRLGIGVGRINPQEVSKVFEISMGHRL